MLTVFRVSCAFFAASATAQLVGSGSGTPDTGRGLAGGWRQSVENITHGDGVDSGIPAEHQSIVAAVSKLKEEVEEKLGDAFSVEGNSALNTSQLSKDSLTSKTV